MQLKTIYHLGILLFLFNNSFSQSSHDENIKLKYNLRTKGSTEKIVFVSTLPNDIPNVQQIRSIEYSHEPSKTYELDGIKYVEFTFLNPIEEELLINVQIRITQNDLITSLKSPNPHEDIEVRYLQEEKYIESNAPLIVKTARKLRRIRTLKTIENTYKYVNKKLQYVWGPNDYGALLALKNGKGKCQDYSDLFVALCRANGIPSRVIEGLVLLDDSKSAPNHAWVEVYLREYGWICFDPTPGNGSTFSKLTQKYVNFSSIRNDERIFNGTRWGWRHWGDNIWITEEIKFGEEN